MRWRPGGQTPDVIDARGGGGGGRMGMPFPGGMRAGGGVGLVGILIFVAIQLLGGGGGGGGYDVGPGFGDRVAAPEPSGGGIPASQDPDRDLRDFSAYVFTNAQDAWAKTFAEQGRRYERAKLVLFRDGVSTGCGAASSAVGPFYCGADQRVYLDLSFYREMAKELGASGDFAWAYVIAHEVGHHVQNQLGTSEKVQRLSSQDSGQRNALSVRLELQADCYAGVWGHTVYSAGDLEEGDVEEATTASEAIGDDRLQRRATGTIDPDTFTHGTSAQRTKWFKVGQQDGEPAECDTFAADEL